jgi:S1-C subfamily serine protease
VLAADGSVVAGATSFRGALYLPKGGTYHLQIDCDAAPGMPPGMPPSPTPNTSNSGPTAFQNTINGNNGSSSDNQNQNQNQNQNDAQNQQAQRIAEMRAQFANQPWHVEVVDMNSAAAKAYAGMPNFNLPGTAVAAADSTGQSSAFGSTTPLPPSAPATPTPTAGKLTEDQARAVVLITGDNAEGTGFMIKTPDGPAIVTNIHVIANNPNLKITTNTGALVTVLSEKGASDRDLALLAIKDAGYNYLDVCTDISQTVQPGDEVITPGNSQGGEVMLNTPGKVLGIGPERIEFDNPIYHGNSGGPVFHTKSGKVLGVVTEAMKVEMTNDLDKASFASRNSAISGAMRYFGLRLDTVSEWVPIDSRAFQIETAFLDQFHEQSRRLDSYLNRPTNNQSENPNGGNTSSGSDDSKLYQNDEKIMKACDSYNQQSSGADTAQQIESLRGLLFDLQSIADLNVTQIENANNFYSFDRERARDELAYRKALKAELDDIGNDVTRLGGLPRSNN